MDEINELQASDAQKRMFFALCKDLGISSQSGKDAVKRRYKLESFANVSKTQLTDVIDKLSPKANESVKKALIEFISMCSPRAFVKKEIGEEYATYQEFVATELLRYFIIKEKKV